MQNNTMVVLRLFQSTELKKNISKLLMIFSLILVLPYNATSQEQKINFGIGFSLANYPNSTRDDYIDALWDYVEIGGHSGFIWSWDKQYELEYRLSDVANIRAIGLKTFVQISIAVLGVPSPPEGYAKSFADPATRALYLDNVRSYAETLPDYMNLATEVNFMYFWAWDEWNNYKTVYREAYDLIKEISPETKVGVSYHYGLFIWQRHFLLPYDLGPYDYIAFTSYPSWLVSEGYYPSIADIPPDWYNIARRAYPSTPIIFSEIGWSSEGLGSPEEQEVFVQNLPRLMSMVHPELVSWVFLHDTTYFNPLWAELFSTRELALLEELSVDVPLLFTHFNGMGLKKIDGTSKPAWNAALTLDFPAFDISQ